MAKSSKFVASSNRPCSDSGSDNVTRILASTALSSSYLGAGLDNVTFDVVPQQPGGPVSPGGVPEPGVWALMILGFGLAGSGLRRQVRLA